MKRITFFIFFVFFFSFGRKILSEITSNLPNQRINNFRFTHFEEGVRKWELLAEEGEIYNQKNEVQLKNFSVNFYRGNERVSRLSAKSGRIEEKNKQMEGKEDVKMESLKEKIKIDAEEMKYLNEEKKVFSSSLLGIKRNETIIKGKKLESSPDFSYLQVRENVSFYDPVKKFNVLSEKMEIYQEKGFVEFKERVKFTKEKSILNADYLNYKEKERIIEAEGNTELFLETHTGEEVIIKAEKIVFYEDKEEIEATKKVKIKYGENSAQSEEAHYYSKEERLELNGGPPLVFQKEEKREGEYQAEKVIFHLAEKRITFEGNVQGIITTYEE